MFRYITIYKIAFFNLLLCGMLLIWQSNVVHAWIKAFSLLGNTGFLTIALRNLSRFIKRNDARLFIGRKRTLVVMLSIGYVIIISFSIWNGLAPRYLFMSSVAWSLLIFVIHLFENSVAAFFHRMFKRGRRIAVVGY